MMNVYEISNIREVVPNLLTTLNHIANVAFALHGCRHFDMQRKRKSLMNDQVREFLGSCECECSDGSYASISSYRVAGSTGLKIIHQAHDMAQAFWCVTSRAFTTVNPEKLYLPLDPAPHL